MAYIVQRKDRFYVVAYDGIDSAIDLGPLEMKGVDPSFQASRLILDPEPSGSADR